MKFYRTVLIISLVLISLFSGIIWDIPTESGASATTVSGPVYGTWNVTNSPYYLTGNVTVPYGQSLTIEAGVEVIANASYHILVGGTLYANGTFANQITFSGNISVSGPYKWEGIIFNSTGSGNIEHCTIEQAIHGVKLDNATSVEIKYTDFEQNKIGLLIKNHSKNNTISDCNIFTNTNGCIIINSSYNTLNGCEILENYGLGVILRNSSYNIIYDSNIYQNDAGISINGGSYYNIINNSYIGVNIGWYKGYYQELGLELNGDCRFNSIIYTELDDNSLEIINVLDSNILISSCELSGNLLVRNSDSISIINSYSYNYPDYYVFEQSNNIDIINCDVSSYEETIIINDNSNNIRIDNCRFTSFQNSGILIQNSNNISVTNSTIYFSNKGIHIIDSKDNTLKNVVANDNNYGLFVYNSENTIIEYGDFLGSEAYGIYFTESIGIRIEGSVFRYNDVGGMLIETDSSNIIIRDSYFYDNDNLGGYINNYCSNVYIYNSSFIQNKVGLKFDSCTNLTIDKCKFNYNYDSGINSEYPVDENSSIYNSEFIQNIQAGATFYSTTLSFINCLFRDNRYNVDLNSIFSENPATAYLFNCDTNSDNNLQSNYTEVYTGWYKNITVRLPNNIPVVSAEITVEPAINDAGFKLQQFKTNLNGMVPEILFYRSYETYGNYYDLDPYNIIVRKAGVGVGARSVNITNSSPIIIDLTNNDLLISKIKTSWPYDKIPINDSFNIIAEIENLGDTAIENIGIRFHISGPNFNQTYTNVTPFIPANGKINKVLGSPLMLIHHGKYTVTATIDYNNKYLETDEENNILSKSFLITERPTAVIIANRTTVYIGEEIKFFANKSFGPVAILEYIFDFGDGKVLSTVENFYGIHSYDKKGEYTVSLQVIDKDGISSYLSNITITVNPHPTPESVPIALFTVQPLIGDVSTSFFFDSSASSPSEGARIIYYSWLFGDGTNSSWASPYNSYKDDGIYEITLIVGDSNDKFSKEFKQQIMIKNMRPIVNLTTNKKTVTVGEYVVFNASNTFDPDDTLSEPLSKFFWYFGDDNNYTESPIQYPDGKYDKITRYAFSEPGDYIVTMVVYDDDSVSNQTSIKIKVLEKKEGDLTGESAGGIFSLSGGIIFIVILGIFILVILLLFYYRKRSQSKIENAEAEKLYGTVGEYPGGTGYGDGHLSGSRDSLQNVDIYAGVSSGYTSEMYGTLSEKSSKKSGSSAGAKKRQGKKKSRIDSVRPVEVEVELSEEKVVNWLDEKSALNHTLTMAEIDIVTDGDLSSAEIIGLEDEADEEIEELKELVESDDEEFEPLEEFEFEPEPEPELEELEPEMEEFESIDESEEVTEFDDALAPEEPELEELESELESESELEPGSEMKPLVEPLGFEEEPGIEAEVVFEEVLDSDEELEVEPELAAVVEYEEEPYTHGEPELGLEQESEFTESDSDDDTIVFEFEEDGETRTAEVNVTEEEVPISTESRQKKKEKLIAIPGVGFITKDELQRVVQDDSTDYARVYEREAHMGTDRPRQPYDPRPEKSKRVIRCMNCFTPIRGKFIKFRPKDTAGKRFAAIGPFCSPQCAAKYKK
jgi:parallel beta-helix repeat protein